MSYQRRIATNTTLYKAVSKYFYPFVNEVQASGKSVPRFVERTFKKYLKCGRLIYGSIRLYCRQCKGTRLLAFSCKCRGFCPSCSGRRMAEASVLQSEEMIPDVAIRQWVLTFPHELNMFLAYRPDVLSEVLDLFVKVLRYFYRTQCLRLHHPPLKGISPDQVDMYSDLNPNDIGTVTCIQRFTDALSLYPHFHTLCTDGVFVSHDQDVQFLDLEVLTDKDLVDVLIYFKHRLVKRFVRRGYLRPVGNGLMDGKFELYWGDVDLNEEELALLRCYAASRTLTHAFGVRSGKKLDVDYSQFDHSGMKVKSKLCVEWKGFSLHAARRVRADERESLTQLCRYIHRPPLAQDRLKCLDNGKFYYQFKRTWSNGAQGITFEGVDLIERLAALIPFPYKNLTRYHGVFAPRSRFKRFMKGRRGVVAQLIENERKCTLHKRRVYYTLWHELMKKVFNIDVLGCPFCGSGMSIVSCISDYQIDVLECLVEYDAEARGPP